MLVNFGDENWSRISGVGPGFYTVPDKSMIYPKTSSGSERKKSFLLKRYGFPVLKVNFINFKA